MTDITAPHHVPAGGAIIIFDYGSQFTRLIARRIREAQVYCEILPHDAAWERVRALNPRGFVLSGGPASVYEEAAPQLPPYVLQSGLPVLGICYGMGLLVRDLGGHVARADHREYGQATIDRLDTATPSPIFAGLPQRLTVLMSHGDRNESLPDGFTALASSANSPYAAMIGPTLPPSPPFADALPLPTAHPAIVGLQFHPEVVHTLDGDAILRNFVYGICGCAPDWTAGSFVAEAVAQIQAALGPEARAVCALSGGVDSMVAASLVQRAIGQRLTCVFVNNGLLREGEAESVVAACDRLGLHLVAVDAAARFLDKLDGVDDPETKRKIIGTEFIRIFEEEARAIGQIDYLVQGTLYPDVIESAGETGARTAARIKTHHNVGGLPADMRFTLLEPLRYLFKDEVRRVGLELGLPPSAVWRQPFPGPGLAVRIIGPITSERLAVLRQADAIVRAEIAAAGLDPATWPAPDTADDMADYARRQQTAESVWQYFAVLTPLQSVGVMGDGRTYANVVGVRAVSSRDGMTADWARLPYDVLAAISSRIVNEVAAVNRVVYDITGKPPATIEWE